MEDTTKKILNAALKVFVKNGFKGATTKEIAKAAEVSEMTLFRKFESKQALFLHVIEPIIKYGFRDHLQEYAKTMDTYSFFYHILDNRLEKISKHYELIRILLTEKSLKNLDTPLDLPSFLFREVNEAIQIHFETQGRKVNHDIISRILIGFLLSHVFWPQKPPYYNYSEPQRKDLIESVIKQLSIG